MQSCRAMAASALQPPCFTRPVHSAQDFEGAARERKGGSCRRDAPHPRDVPCRFRRLDAQHRSFATRDTPAVPLMRKIVFIATRCARCYGGVRRQAATGARQASVADARRRSAQAGRRPSDPSIHLPALHLAHDAALGSTGASGVRLRTAARLLHVLARTAARRISFCLPPPPLALLILTTRRLQPVFSPQETELAVRRRRQPVPISRVAPVPVPSARVADHGRARV